MSYLQLFLHHLSLSLHKKKQYDHLILANKYLNLYNYVSKITIFIQTIGMAISLADYDLSIARQCPGGRRGCDYSGGAVQIRIQQ